MCGIGLFYNQWHSFLVDCWICPDYRGIEGVSSMRDWIWGLIRPCEYTEDNSAYGEVIVTVARNFITVRIHVVRFKVPSFLVDRDAWVVNWLQPIDTSV